MPRKHYAPVPLVKIRKILRGAILDSSPRIKRTSTLSNEIESQFADIGDMIRNQLGLQQPQRKSNNMIFFIMYDIEDDKVRTQVSKYLLHEGGMRIQKSIFLADLPFEKMEKIMIDLTEVQACYENNDSIIILPLSSDYLNAMKTIGKKINIKFIKKEDNVAFF